MPEVRSDRPICEACGEYEDECACTHYEEPVLPFDTDDPAFALGVEVGVTWATLQQEEDAAEFMVHTANVEMMLRIAEALGRRCIGHEHDETWTTVNFGPVGVVD